MQEEALVEYEPPQMLVTDEPGYSGERRLWQAILLTYYRDLSNAIDESKRMALAAWAQTEYFEEVCEFAGVDIGVAKDWVNRLLIRAMAS